MNKNVLIGSLVAIIVIGSIIFFSNQARSVVPVAATDTTRVPTNTDTTQTPPVDAVAVPGKPIATTNATVAPTDTTAVVTGTVVPQGAITTYWYEYGTTKGYGKKTSNQIAGSGYTSIPTPGYITGLTKNTTYYFQLVAKNELGQVVGGQNTVTTTENSPPPVGMTPTATTVAATGVTVSTASLKGQVNPSKVPTQYWFEYGAQGSLGTVTTFVSVGDGSSSVEAGANITNLKPGTTYYYRLNAQNQFGTVNGAILTFKTSGKPIAEVPIVTTQVTGSVATTTAIVRGTVNTNGAQTTYSFEYSTDSGFAPTATKSTQQKSAGSSVTTVAVQATLSGLVSNTMYYVRIVAQNSGGTVKGDSQSFKTK